MSLFGSRVLTVSGLTQYLRALLESDEILRDVWVEGEVSTLSKPSSGHIYFNLKDNNATLRCVIWRQNAMRIQAALQNGMALEVHGYLSVYDAGGQYQIYVDAIRMAGEGFLYRDFLRLKALLEAEGIFDAERKRKIPEQPKKIGIVTSPSGAALQDMLTTLSNRYPLLEVVLVPTVVQGEEAPLKIVKAIQRLNQLLDVDVIIVARGGGSMEDLWAFNDERVVRAISESRIPVVTGIGHETDTTLSDYAADLRAATPTGAAVLVSPDRLEMLASINELQYSLDVILSQRLNQYRQNLVNLLSRLKFQNPINRIMNNQQSLDEIQEKMRRAMNTFLLVSQHKLNGLSSRIEALNPLQILQRGYAIVRNKGGSMLLSVKQARTGEEISIQLKDGLLGSIIHSLQVRDE